MKVSISTSCIKNAKKNPCDAGQTLPPLDFPPRYYIVREKRTLKSILTGREKNFDRFEFDIRGMSKWHRAIEEIENVHKQTSNHTVQSSERREIFPSYWNIQSITKTIERYLVWISNAQAVLYQRLVPISGCTSREEEWRIPISRMKPARQKKKGVSISFN